MEKDFLDLLKTFDKTTQRLEVLDHTILNFKGVIEDLRQNLDELVEMVQLEQIVDLSQRGSQKIQSLHQNFDEMSAAYERLLHVDEMKQSTIEKIAHLEEKLDQLMEQQTMSVTPVNLLINSTRVVEDARHLYYINTLTNQLMMMKKEDETTLKAVGDLQVIELACENNTVFGLECDSGAILTLCAEQVISRLELNAKRFIVKQYEIYYLCETELRRYHLLTQQNELLLSDVQSFERLNEQLICQTHANSLVRIQL